MLLLICTLPSLLVMGCGKDPKADATDELAASFEGSAAKDDVLAANRLWGRSL